MAAWVGCLPRGGGCLPKEVFSQGGGVCRGGGCLPKAGVCQTPPPPVNRMTGVKTLPCRNYVADGN